MQITVANVVNKLVTIVIVEQVAKHVFKAAHVAATGSASKTEFLKSLGADKVIDYKSENYVEMPERYDIIFDTVGKSAFDLIILLSMTPTTNEMLSHA